MKPKRGNSPVLKVRVSCKIKGKYWTYVIRHGVRETFEVMPAKTLQRLLKSFVPKEGDDYPGTAEFLGEEYGLIEA